MTLNKSNRPNPLNEQGRPDAEACRKILADEATVEDLIGALSTSETICVVLAFGRDDLLPRSHKNFRAAWRRLDQRQRTLVDLAVKSRWSAKYESPAC